MQHANGAVLPLAGTRMDSAGSQAAGTRPSEPQDRHEKGQDSGAHEPAAAAAAILASRSTAASSSNSSSGSLPERADLHASMKEAPSPTPTDIASREGQEHAARGTDDTANTAAGLSDVSAQDTQDTDAAGLQADPTGPTAAAPTGQLLCCWPWPCRYGWLYQLVYTHGHVKLGGRAGLTTACDRHTN